MIKHLALCCGRLMAKRTATPRVRKVDQVVAALQKKWGIGERAARNKSLPWLDGDVSRPSSGFTCAGWYSAA
jgi:hypothetical protein